MPPPVRYPLPTLILLLAGSLIFWRGEVATRPLRQAITQRFERVLAGPPVPASPSPMKIVGPIVRRVLLREGGVEATDVPGGRLVETVRLKQFLDVYDLWPPTGPTTHFRVGNRRPIGWITALDAIDWGTRLVSRRRREADGTVPSSRPVVEWNAGQIRVLIWAQSSPWADVIETRWLSEKEASEDEQGAWLSRGEWLGVMGRVGKSDSPERLAEERLRILTGQLGRGAPWTNEERSEVRRWLPARATDAKREGAASVLERLARVNESWTDEVVWSGIGFRFVPLSDLP